MNKKIGIVGAGTMGRGVAQVFAQSGYDVLLHDISAQTLTDSKSDIFSNLRMQRMFQKEAISPEEGLSHIQFIDQIETLGEAKIIIENISESVSEKKALYQRLANICPADCLYLVNTSCISITEIAATMPIPENIIGVHFMNPAPMIKAVEVIRGFHTADDTVNSVIALLESVGKEGIIVKDFPGFVSNRISHLMMNEAAFIVQDQVADPASVDAIFKKCYGHKMGPLETADLIGLDTVVDSLRILYESFQDCKFRCCPLLKKMVAAGCLGRKNKKGFYLYE